MNYGLSIRQEGALDFLSLGALILFGLVTALLRIRTGSIYPSLAVHVAFNALGMIGPLFI